MTIPPTATVATVITQRATGALCPTSISTQAYAIPTRAMWRTPHSRPKNKNAKSPTQT